MKTIKERQESRMSEEMNIDQSIDIAVKKWHATKTNMSMALSTFGVVSLATHSPGGVFLGACTAYVAGRHGDDIARSVQNMIPQEVVGWARARLGYDQIAQPKDARDALPEPQTEKLAAIQQVNVVEPDFPRPRKNVNLASDLSILVDDIAGKAILITGMRRSGKTTLGALLAEQFGKLYIPLFIPDFEGDYLSLADVLPRAVIAGHPSAARQYVEYDFVGVTHSDAANLGHAILDQGYQVILDLASYPTLEEGIAAQIQVIRGMFKWAEMHPDERTTAHVYLDEAQRYLPQTLAESVIDDQVVLEGLFKIYKDVIAIGGKRGISPVILTQRLAQVNKKIMAQSEVIFVMRQTNDNDLKRCMEYVKTTTATPEDISKFKQGQGVYIANDGSQKIHQFDPRRSDGKRGATPTAEKALRYAEMPVVVGKNMGASNVRQLRPVSEPTHQQNSARTSAPLFAQDTLKIDDTDPYGARTGKDVRPDDEPAHTTHDDAQGKYRLNDEQIRLFCAIYPNANPNKDECLKLVGANSKYRDHANELIERFHLLAKRG
jgi:hypothetical protein